MKTMTDAWGREVPVKYVKKEDRERDARVRRIHARFVRARAMLERLVAESLDDVRAIQAARGRTGARGCFAARSFDGRIEVRVEQAYRITLDERVIEARRRMLDYAQRLCDRAGDDAKALFEIVQEAFQADKAGTLSVGRVMSLVKRNINAPEWVEARQMLLDAIQTERSKAYLRCGTRLSEQRDFEQIRLDLADCWPVEIVAESGTARVTTANPNAKQLVADYHDSLEAAEEAPDPSGETPDPSGADGKEAAK